MCSAYASASRYECLCTRFPTLMYFLAEGVILIKRLVAAMLTGRTAHSTQQKPPRRPELPVSAGRLFAFMKRGKVLRGLRRWSG